MSLDKLMNILCNKILYVIKNFLTLLIFAS